MNKKGFTVVELTVSFSLVSIIAIMLFNLIFSLKELYVSGDIKTSLLNKQAIMDKKIYDDLNTRELRSITACGISCLNFEYADGTAKFLIDVGANTITYGNYTMKLNNGTKIEPVSFGYGCELNSSTDNCTQVSDVDNDVFHLDVPIKTSLLDDDFGIHIVKTYNTSLVAINKNLPFTNATIIANGVTMPLTLIDGGEDWSIALDSENEPNFSTENTETNVIFAHIYHQEQGTYYEDYNSFLKSKSDNKKSTLKSLEIFRNEERVSEITDVLKEVQDKEKDKKQVDEDFAKGYFELILDYPGLNNAGAFRNYNRWIQTSNFTTDKKLVQGLFIDTMNSGTDASKWQNGLRYINGEQSYVTGSNNNDLFAIGMKKNSTEGYKIKNPDNTDATSVDIWVRANEYIEKYKLVTLIF